MAPAIRGRYGPSPTRTQRQPVPAPARARSSRERRRQHVEALVLLEPADAEQQPLACGQPEPVAQRRGGGGGGARGAIDRLEIDRVRHDVDARRIDGEVRTHRRHQRVIGREDRVGGPRAAPHRRLERRVGEPLELREAGMRAAELLEALRVEDERRADVRLAGEPSA